MKTRIGIFSFTYFLMLFAMTLMNPVMSLGSQKNINSCSADEIRQAEDLLERLRQRTEQTERYLEDCRGNLVESECLRYLLDKGYGPNQAKQACEGFRTTEFSCFKFMMEKGYGPNQARSTCVGMEEAELSCFTFMIGKGYGPSQSNTTCADVNFAEAECIQDMMNRGYGPSQARSTCKN